MDEVCQVFDGGEIEMNPSWGFVLAVRLAGAGQRLKIWDVWPVSPHFC